MAAAMRLQTALRLAKSISRPVFRITHSRHALNIRYRQNATIICNHSRFLTTQAEPESSENADYHSIITDTEKATGQSNKHEFQSETKMLLDIVAKSLYSDKEVFVRELISNASDALEKLRYLRINENLSIDEGGDRSLEVHIATDKQNRLLTIQDTGIGMTKEELISNLGTIARSGSKAFMEKLKEKNGADETSNIIGQFGVGFYSAFMVADKVEVFTKSYKKDAEGLHWVSDGTGTYEISNADGVQPGTKIIMHLKPDCREFSDNDTIQNIIKKYSNFVGSAIYVNGKRANVIEPLWMLDPKDVTPQQHEDFYKFIGNAYDKPRFTLHYTTDVPLSIRALLYFPDKKPPLFELSRDVSIGISLYSRKVLIKSNADNIIPKWLRFVKGVVDSEDIPLNLSRELLQNSALIAKLQSVLTTRILRFLIDRSLKQKDDYIEFYKDYGLFLKEGMVMGTDESVKQDIGKLLRFESSRTKSGEFTSFAEYCERFSTDQKEIFYLAAPNRTLAEQSPYYESFKKRNIEVLFCYEPYDELILMHLRDFKSHNLISVERDMRQDTEKDKTEESKIINQEEVDNLISFMKKTLEGKAAEVKTTTRLESHPCVITVPDMSSSRHFLRTQGTQFDDEMRLKLIQPRFDVNANHPIIKKLTKLTSTDPKLAELLVHQLFTSAMVGAGLIDDPRTLLSSMNKLLEHALEKL